MRIVRIVARVLFVVVMVVVAVLVVLQSAFYTGGSKLDSLYLPTKASMLAHADKLATHFLNRLSQPPMPLQIAELGTDSSYNRIGDPFAYPYLASDDLPQRFDVRWTSTDGWLSDLPKLYRDRLERMMRVMTEKHTEGVWENISQFSIVGTESNDPDSLILAGQWTFGESGTAFRGAITSGFYEYYAPRWFLEYKAGYVNRYLDNYMWAPAEFRIAFHDSTLAPIVLRPSQTVDMVEQLKTTDDMPDTEPEAARMTMAMRWMNKEMNGEPGWQENVTWQEAPIGTYKVKIQVASPFRMDTILQSYAAEMTRWTIGLLFVAMIFGILGWGSIKR